MKFALALGAAGVVAVGIAIATGRFDVEPDPTSRGEHRPGDVASGPGGKDFPAVHDIAELRPRSEAVILDAPGGDEIGTAAPVTAFGQPTTFSVAERRGPWMGVATEDAGDEPGGWIRYDGSDFRLATTPYSIHVDLGARIIELWRGDRAVKSGPVETGSWLEDVEPGRYGVSDRVDAGISPLFGDGALTLTALSSSAPADWPAGERVAIHGEGSGQERSIEVSDATIAELLEKVPLGAPAYFER